jgi:CNT family concentrative nucleoside transporter
MMFQSIAGLVAFIFFAWMLSENRRQIPYKTIIAGITIQILIGALLLKSSFFRNLFISLNHVILSLEAATTAGTTFVFGFLGGGDLPFTEKTPGSSFILAFRSFPLVLVISALSSLLFYWRILPFVIKGISRMLKKTMNLGGAEGLGVAANIFVGMVEAPLLIRPYLSKMTRSELFTLMTCGMATIAGTVMVLYASILKGTIPDIMGHILTASIISAPAAIVVSKTMIPETRRPTSGEIYPSEKVISAMDALTKGTIQGIQLLINIIGMIIVLVACVHLINTIIGLLPEINGQPITLQGILGLLMAPVAWLMGIPWDEAITAGSLLGTKTILNEFIAYIDMSHLPPGALSEKSLIIMTYALCGFANPGSLGIMIGGLGSIAPDKRNEIISLGFRSIIAGTIATCMTGAIAGIVS